MTATNAPGGQLKPDEMLDGAVRLAKFTQDCGLPGFTLEVNGQAVEMDIDDLLELRKLVYRFYSRNRRTPTPPRPEPRRLGYLLSDPTIVASVKSLTEKGLTAEAIAYEISTNQRLVEEVQRALGISRRQQVEARRRVTFAYFEKGLTITEVARLTGHAVSRVSGDRTVWLTEQKVAA